MFGCFHYVKLRKLFLKLNRFRNVLMIKRCKLLVYKFTSLRAYKFTSLQVFHIFEVATVYTLLMIVC
jgi:uncharacterized protein YpbB